MSYSKDPRRVAAQQECKNDVDPTPFHDGELYCGQVWDTVSCWPPTRGGETAVKSCPEYLMSEPFYDGYATRVCEPNGNWRFYPDKNSTWSNYSQCISITPPTVDPIIHHQRPLQIVYTVGYSLSLIALIIAMVIFLYFRKLRCPRNTIHMHFFVSFILRAVFVFIRDIMQNHADQMVRSYELDGATLEYPYQSVWCKLAFTLVQYFLVSNYYWLLVEGVYLHSLITLAVFSGRTSLRYYFLLGWGCPGLIVLPWALQHVIVKTPGCWWEEITTDNSYWIIKAPVMASILVNFVLFLNITRVLATKLRASNAAEARVYSKLAKSTLVLIPIFGAYYIITVGMHASTGNQTVSIVRMYVDLIISPFQGLIMAVLYCFLNGEVQQEIKRKWTVHKINRTLSTNRSVAAATRSQIHSRDSNSTPPRKESVGGDGGGDGSGGGGNHNNNGGQRFTFLGRLLAFKSRLFHTKTSRKSQMNGSVEKYKDSPTKRSGSNEKANKSSPLAAVYEDAAPTETTRLHQDSPEDGIGSEEAVVDKTSLSSDKNELLKDDDSGHVCSGDSRSPSLTNERAETESKKGVHFAKNIETEV